MKRQKSIKCFLKLAGNVVLFLKLELKMNLGLLSGVDVYTFGSFLITCSHSHSTHVHDHQVQQCDTDAFLNVFGHHYPLMCSIEKDWVREDLPSPSCHLWRDSEPSDRKKKEIGHFHIYSSVRSRAVYRERGRKEGGLQPQELWGFTSLLLPLFYLWTHTLLCQHGHTKKVNRREVRRRTFEGDRGGSGEEWWGVIHTRKNRTCTKQRPCEWTTVNATNRVTSQDLIDRTSTWGRHTGHIKARCMWRRIDICSSTQPE